MPRCSACKRASPQRAKGLRADALTTEPLTALCSRATFKCGTRTGRGGPGPLGRALESAVTTHVFPTVRGAPGIFGAQLMFPRSVFVEAGHWDEGRARVSPPHPGPCHPSPPPPQSANPESQPLNQGKGGPGGHGRVTRPLGLVAVWGSEAGLPLSLGKRASPAFQKGCANM